MASQREKNKTENIQPNIQSPRIEDPAEFSRLSITLTFSPPLN